MNFTKTEQLYPRMERIVMGVILVNSAIIFIQAYGVESQWLTLIDIICTLIFVGEMALKMRVEGFLATGAATGTVLMARWYCFRCPPSGSVSCT